MIVPLGFRWPKTRPVRGVLWTTGCIIGIFVRHLCSRGVLPVIISAIIRLIAHSVLLILLRFPRLPLLFLLVLLGRPFVPPSVPLVVLAREPAHTVGGSATILTGARVMTTNAHFPTFALNVVEPTLSANVSATNKFNLFRTISSPSVCVQALFI